MRETAQGETDRTEGGASHLHFTALMCWMLRQLKLLDLTCEERGCAIVLRSNTTISKVDGLPLGRRWLGSLSVIATLCNAIKILVCR